MDNMVYIERELEKEIQKWIDEREILVIRGPRQCGKTTLLNRIKKRLIETGVEDLNIVYIDFDDDLVRMSFENNCKEFINSYIVNNKKTYFLFDEVQNIKDVGKKLKIIFDLVNNQKIIATGSSSFDLTSLGKYLVGRVIFFNLLPFNFLEFLRAKNERYEKIYKEIKINLHNTNLKESVLINELNGLLHEYLTFGGYPRVVLESDKEKKKEILKNLFITYIEKDVIPMYGNKYRDKIVVLLKSLSEMLGNVIKYETLTENTGLKYNELKEIIPLLQDSFIISVVTPFYKNLITELRKNPKIYFVDFGIRNYLLSNFNNLDFAHLYENFVYNQLKTIHNIKYWRTTSKTEVDFVAVDSIIIPIEVKSTPKVTRALRSFISTYSAETAFIPNLSIAKKVDIDKCSIFMAPFVYF